MLDVDLRGHAAPPHTLPGRDIRRALHERDSLTRGVAGGSERQRSQRAGRHVSLDLLDLQLRSEKLAQRRRIE